MTDCLPGCRIVVFDAGQDSRMIHELDCPNSPDKFRSLAPRPTEHEREILEILAEECAEIGKGCIKALRFGLPEVQPGQAFSNTVRIAHEVGDFLEVVDLAVREGILQPLAIEDGRAHKRLQLAKFMQTNTDHKENPSGS